MLQRLLFHIACVIALAWPAFINGQPFYFPDTTSYVRAADSAAFIFSGERISTEWTDHYRSSLEPAGAVSDVAHHISSNANDLGTGSVMAGRSPYFGILLWLSYVISRFWLFVVAQAIVSYVLIRISLRMFGLGRPAIVAGCVAALALLTSLPFFTALLMPDLLAGLGILGFLLLAIERGRLSRHERWGLFAVILVSVFAHLTHILILAGMAVVLSIWALLRRWPRRRFVPLTGAIMGVVVAGLLSVMITSAVVERTFGREPQLVPLLTSRFVADGPGLDYLRHSCPKAGFAVCAYRDRPSMTASEFLWSTEPGIGVYMLADTTTRRAMSSEDKAFALAVLRAYPLQQGGLILLNGWRQMTRFDIDLLNSGCGRNPDCWSLLPPRERAALLASAGGSDLWPQRVIAVIHYLTVGLAVVALVAWLFADARKGGERAEDIMLWLLLLAAAMAVNALLGGGISDPQPRYQARIVWLLPFLAIIAGLVWRRRGQAGAAEG